jgi:hypothetical protein
MQTERDYKVCLGTEDSHYFAWPMSTIEMRYLAMEKKCFQVGWRCISLVEHMLSKLEAMGLILSTTKKEKNVAK